MKRQERKEVNLINLVELNLVEGLIGKMGLHLPEVNLVHGLLEGELAALEYLDSTKSKGLTVLAKLSNRRLGLFEPLVLLFVIHRVALMIRLADRVHVA